jgi:hypothetical protein
LPKYSFSYDLEQISATGFEVSDKFVSRRSIKFEDRFWGPRKLTVHWVLPAVPSAWAVTLTTHLYREKIKNVWSCTSTTLNVFMTRWFSTGHITVFFVEGEITSVCRHNDEPSDSIKQVYIQ